MALAAPRTVVEVVSAALDGGAPSIQLRLKGASTRERVAVGRDLRALTRNAGALLFVNDRMDVAEAVDADGVHVGPEDPSVADLRVVWGDAPLIGASTDDPEVARRLVDQGADYLGCGAVFPTSTKDVGDEAIGPAGLARVAAAVSVPVVGIGGVDAAGAARLAGTGAAGVAVVGAVMRAADPAEAVRQLLAATEHMLP